MLSHLSIQNFTLVDSLELDLRSGMTAITGETGAGKSILLGALGWALGDRADAGRVRLGAKRADITASFDLSQLNKVRLWLEDQDLDSEDDCLLRRTVSSEGRSKAYINGQPVPLGQLRELGSMLIDIHSQHEHQTLLKKDNHRSLLDQYGGHQDLCHTVKLDFKSWQHLDKKFRQLRDNFDEFSARHQLLSYQLEELDKLELSEGEVARLEQEQQTLSSAEQLLSACQQASDICTGEHASLLNGLSSSVNLLNDFQANSAIGSVVEMLESARIQIDEASRDLTRFADNFEADPNRLIELDQRLSAIYELARKHRVQPEELIHFQEQLRQELSGLSGSDTDLDELENQAQLARQSYGKSADKLQAARKQAAEKLSCEVNLLLSELSMPHAALSCNHSILGEAANQHGHTEPELLICTNPGQTPGSLHKIASGGELSRISLAIQVVLAQGVTLEAEQRGGKSAVPPTLVFDEVDVGIGGATGDVVGRLLRSLSERGQILCVTHLAQVASKAHQHLQVVKTSLEDSAQSTLIELTGEDKVKEIARMFGGETINEQTLAHARTVLAS